ncbi:PorT family protein [Hymenobacter sp. 5516J-16]|uniref:porin family protein n=1 Tax=Hymenobacter sp. 5516J-16 TaxID=2932253 RepID=UPI001FD4515C|nr:porin family protein [Hymenobacter sp. 5516J-16]UOQ75815.1 PorT family protein [Hymenobacter sp. 5516J-16]
MRLFYGFFVTLFVLVNHHGTAQRIQLGLRGGGVITHGIGANATNSSPRFGGEGGALIRIKITQQLALQAEGLYAQRGDKSTSYGPSIMHRLNYLSLPVLAQYHYGDVFFEAGPSFSQLYAATPTIAQSTNSSGTVFRSRELGFIVGIGYQDSTGLMLGWRYNGGLNNVYRRVDLAGSSQVQLRNSAIEFYLGYLFEPKEAAHLAVGSAKLAFVTTPVLLFKGSKFLFYTAPGKLFRGIGKKRRQATTDVVSPPNEVEPK